MTPEQVRRREQAESLIGVAAPFLNLVLAVGERISKLVEPEDTEYYPPRTTRDGPPPKPGAPNGR
jgi:hypothetical protein